MRESDNGIYALRIVSALKAMGLKDAIGPRFNLDIKGRGTVTLDLSATAPELVLDEVLRQVYSQAHAKGYDNYRQQFRDLLEIK